MSVGIFLYTRRGGCGLGVRVSPRGKVYTHKGGEESCLRENYSVFVGILLYTRGGGRCL